MSKLTKGTELPPSVKYLIDLIEHHAKKYYTEDNPEIEDEVYDALVSQLRIECKSYGIPTSKVPCLVRVGSDRAGHLVSVKHPVRMLSLDNIYDQEGLFKFLKRVISLCVGQSESTPFGLTYKLDGLAISLTYSFGRLIGAATRGDGMKGESVLAQVLSVPTIPKQLGNGHIGILLPKLVVHGELFVKKSDFSAYVNSAHCPIGKEPKSPRTLAGTIRSTSSKLRGVTFTFNPHYVALVKLNLDDPSDSGLDQTAFTDAAEQLEEIFSPSLLQRLSVLKSFGFSVIPPIAVFADGIDSHQVESIMDRLDSQRHKDEFDLPIDGVVIHVDNYELIEVLSHTARIPRWAIAYKFPALSATTTLLDVQWQVTANANIVPVANFKPLEIGGHTYSKANLYNHTRCKSMQLHYGDTITVSRQADVTPKIIGVVLPRSTSALPITMPRACPSCDQPLDVVGLDLKCLNNISCPEQITQRFLRFVGKEGMDITGLGIKLVRKLVEVGRVRSVLDLYTLKNYSMGLKTWNAILRDIERSKGRDLYHVLSSLGLTGLSSSDKTALCKQYADLQTILTSPNRRDWLSERGEQSILECHDVIQGLTNLGIGNVNPLHDSH